MSISRTSGSWRYRSASASRARRTEDQSMPNEEPKRGSDGDRHPAQDGADAAVLDGDVDFPRFAREVQAGHPEARPVEARVRGEDAPVAEEHPLHGLAVDLEAPEGVASVVDAANADGDVAVARHLGLV